jgi:putative membrane protein
VAPFYSVLAIWVGMTILVSILKVHVDKNKFPDGKPHEYFLGRYLLFFLLSEIQAIVIVAGDLYLFGVQCKHPAALFLVAMVTSLTFSLLIYSLTISFGDIGKALAVVVMVIQIAGSGGTYPIEALPAFFRAVYIFFPFPYAINAMRECIGGMYQQDLTIYLLKLLVFCAAALLIGLVVRIPFMNLNHFIEKRMEDTKMM